MDKIADTRRTQMESHDKELENKDVTSDKKYPDYCRTMVIKDANGQMKELVFPKALDLDRPKRARTQFSQEQLFHLEREFMRNQYLVGKDRTELADNLGLSETQVKVWFQNRRTKHKRDKIGGDVLIKAKNDDLPPYSAINLMNTNPANKDMPTTKLPGLDFNQPNHLEKTKPPLSSRLDAIRPVKTVKDKEDNHHERRDYTALTSITIPDIKEQNLPIDLEKNKYKNAVSNVNTAISKSQIPTYTNLDFGIHNPFQYQSGPVDSQNTLFGHFPRPNLHPPGIQPPFEQKYEQPLYGLPNVPTAPHHFSMPVRIPALRPHQLPPHYMQ